MNCSLNSWFFLRVDLTQFIFFDEYMDEIGRVVL